MVDGFFEFIKILFFFFKLLESSSVFRLFGYFDFNS